jgi:predicted membrane protein
MTTGSGPPVSSDRPLPLVQIVIGAVLIVLGVGWLLNALDVAAIPWRALLAAVLIVVGAATAATAGRDGNHRGLIAVGSILVLLLAIASTASSILDVPLRGGFGDRAVTPHTMSDLSSEYRLIAGQMVIDLGELDLPAGDTELDASVALGRLVIDNVPSDVAVHATAHVTIGEVVLFDQSFSGVGVDEERGDAGFTTASRRLVIEARVGLGQIEVRP